MRYKYEATIWDTDKVINNEIFTFDRDGKFVSVKKVGLKDVKAYKDIDPNELGITVYSVDRIVSSFPAVVDFSTPENTYVVANRIIAEGNDPAWPEISASSLSALMRKGNRQRKTVDPSKAQKYLNAKIIEVHRKGSYASVIGRFPGLLPQYDIRSFKHENAKWLNNGNCGARTLSRSRAIIAQSLDYYNQQEQSSNEPSALNQPTHLNSFSATLYNGVTVEDSRNLLMERKDILQKTLQTVEQKYNNGRANSKQLQQAKIDLLRVESELSERPQKRIDILDQIVTLYLEQEKTAKLLLDSGRVTQDELNKVKHLRLDAENELARAKAEGNEQQTDFKAILPNGLTIELVGVCEHPSKDKQWWRPDGTELSKEIRVRTRGRVSASGIPYTVAVKVTMPEDATFEPGRIKGATGRLSLEAVDSEGRPISNMRAWMVYIDEKLTATSIQLGAADGPWKTRARDSSRGGKSTAGIVFSKAYESDGGVRIIVADEHLDLDYRIAAIDTQGKEHLFQQRGGSAGKVRQTTALFHDIKLNQIEYFLFQTRPYQWVTFKNVSLRPGQKTDVHVEVEPVVGEWEDVGKAVPADFNDTISLAEHITVASIGQNAEGKTFIALLRDREKTRNQQYRFILIRRSGTVVEPSSLKTNTFADKLREKFSFDMPYHHNQIKEFRLQRFPQNLARKASLPVIKPYDPGVNGKIAAQATSGPPGRGALHFDGQNDYLYVPDSWSLWMKAPFTVEMWIKPEFPKEQFEHRTSWGLIGKGCIGKDWILGMGKVEMRGFGITLHRFGDDPNLLMVDYCAANLGRVYTKPYGRSDFDDWMHLYHVFHPDRYTPGHTHPLVIGRFLTSEHLFAGKIGEIRIWVGARSRDQISEYRNKPLTGDEPDLVACWTFEQSGGQIAYDISNHRNHARLGTTTDADDADPTWVTVTGGSTPVKEPGNETDDQVIARSTIEPIGKHALSFDGVDDYLHVAANSTLMLKSPFTIEMWLKPDFSDIPRTKDSEKLWPFLSLLRKGKRLFQEEKIQAGGFMMFVGPSSQQDRKCYGNLYLGSEDGLLYQVGRFGGERLQPTRPSWLYVSMSCTKETYIPVPEQPLMIGQNIVPSGFPFKGDIAEIRIWSDVRSGYQVARYRNKPLNGNEPGLVACWDFKRPGGQVVYDIGPNGNHARLGGSEGPDNADPKWVDLQAPSPQPNLKTDAQVESIKRKAEISGFVEDENGSPIAGASVTLLNKELFLLPKPEKLGEMVHLVISDHFHNITDTNGRFEFVDLNPGKTDISVKSQGYRTEILREITTGTKNLRITLGKPSAYTLAGDVVDGKGNPISGVEITLAGESSTTVPTDEKGVFRFEDQLKPTTVRRALALFARKKGFGVWGKTLDTTGGQTYVKIILLPEEKISGRVVDQIGKPIANATILFWSSVGRDTTFSFTGKWQEIALRTGTDANGQFTLTGIPTESDISLRALAPGYASSEIYSVKTGEFGSYAVRNKDRGTTMVHGSNREPAETIEFKLQKAVTLCGTLTYDDSGRPAPGLKIMTQSHKRSQWAKTRTDLTGRFELEGVSPNPCNLLVFQENSGKDSLPKWTAAAIEFDDLQEGETRSDIRLVLTKGGIIRGKAVDAEGNPLYGIDIAFYSAARPRSGGSCQATNTAKDGSWAYRFPPGEVYVYIRTTIPEGNWSRKSYTLLLDDGQEIDDIDFELSRVVSENSPYR